MVLMPATQPSLHAHTVVAEKTLESRVKAATLEREHDVIDGAPVVEAEVVELRLAVVVDEAVELVMLADTLAVEICEVVFALVVVNTDEDDDELDEVEIGDVTVELDDVELDDDDTELEELVADEVVEFADALRAA
ncbi:hypothetical protein LTR35_002634 [Friedmanniomyces endolithicus]|nr:hypothetical protein LTR35_002634 [Friedmanniomyces endolithicus]KAK0291386.1 hypothetical protein LTS00_008386 [Friedmanniomyces endolithicus]KAK1019516.1 hypothetical protein LTR54_000158 [Friedmanniomyces endolithicus]